MEEMRVVGTRSVDFDDKQGRHISGLSLYVTHPETGVDGLVAEKLFVNAERLEASHYVPKVGDVINIIWGRNSRILGVTKVKVSG